MAQTAFANKIQKLCLPPNDYFPNELYFRGRARIKGKKIVIYQGETVSFDTYFNIFPLFKWLRYTKMQDLAIDIALRGGAEITIFGIDRAKNDSQLKFSKEKKISSTLIDAEEESTHQILCCCDMSLLPDFIYLTVTATRGDVELSNVFISTSAEWNRNLNIACCFCTYKREKEIKQNIENLLCGIVHSENSNIFGKLSIYVADNGQTLPLDLYEKEHAVHIFHNKNYGGSAGFTRCMIESCLRNKGTPYTHVILMDDDALILPEVVERTAALVGILKDEYRDYMVGGAYLRKESPSIQHTCGEFQDIGMWRRVSYGSNMDLCGRENILGQEIIPESEMNYNGWWYSCIPADIITVKNLPLPLFIHDDDIEYGVRNGGKFIWLNGICVWHPALSGIAKQKAYIKYYDVRNSMILQSSFCPEESTTEVLIYFLKRFCAYVLNYQYESMAYASLAFGDFYKGVNCFKSVDAEELNSKLMRYKPFEICHISEDELENVKMNAFQVTDKSGGNITGAEEKRAESNRPSNSRILKLLLNWFIPAYKGRVTYSDDVSLKDIDFIGAKEVCVVDLKTGKGIIFRKSYRYAFLALKDFLGTSITILMKHHNIYKEWHNGIAELQSYDFWKKYLGI